MFAIICLRRVIDYPMLSEQAIYTETTMRKFVRIFFSAIADYPLHSAAQNGNVANFTEKFS